MENIYYNEIDNNDKIKEYIKTYRLVIIKLHAKWCRPCKTIIPKYNLMAEFYTDKSKDIVFLSIDIDENNYFENLVNAVPCFLIFKNGKLDKENIIYGANLESIDKLCDKFLKNIQRTTKL